VGGRHGIARTHGAILPLPVFAVEPHARAKSSPLRARAFVRLDPRGSELWLASGSVGDEAATVPESRGFGSPAKAAQPVEAGRRVVRQPVRARGVRRHGTRPAPGPATSQRLRGGWARAIIARQRPA